MPKNIPPYQFFDFGTAYHIYSRVSGNELIFQKDENYHFFLRLMTKYLIPYMEIYGYCLLPNQFDLLVAFRGQVEICTKLNCVKEEYDEEKTHQFLMRPLKNMLTSYAKAYNKMYHRKGALFIDYVKRLRLEQENSMVKILNEIHQLPVNIKFVDRPDNWNFSSFNAYVRKRSFSQLNRERLAKYFS